MARTSESYHDFRGLRLRWLLVGLTHCTLGWLPSVAVISSVAVENLYLPPADL